MAVTDNSSPEHFIGDIGEGDGDIGEGDKHIGEDVNVISHSSGDTVMQLQSLSQSSQSQSQSLQFLISVVLPILHVFWNSTISC